LSEEFHLTQQQAADAVGKSRVAVTNLLRLLNLAAPVREMLAAGELEMGHARALLSLSALEQEQAARQVVARGLSVRQTEALVRQRTRPPTLTPIAATRRRDPDTERLEVELSAKIGAPVSINFDGKSNGTLVIRYSTLEELEGILAHLK
jgi:ParB family transcriptional regulator, chromosome partitioning protein